MPNFDPVAVMSRVSGNSENETQCSVDDELGEISVESVKMAAYVLCVNDRNWFIVVVLDISVEYNEMRVKFMHAKGPAKNSV